VETEATNSRVVLRQDVTGAPYGNRTRVSAVKGRFSRLLPSHVISENPLYADVIGCFSISLSQPLSDGILNMR